MKNLKSIRFCHTLYFVKKGKGNNSNLIRIFPFEISWKIKWKGNNSNLKSLFIHLNEVTPFVHTERTEV